MTELAEAIGRRGRYIETTAAGETVRAYIPPPLPPVPPVRMDDLLGRLAAASQAVGRLDGISADSCRSMGSSCPCP
jgi:uncharacterized protein YbjT (DUF2867 family)